MVCDGKSPFVKLVFGTFLSLTQIKKGQVARLGDKMRFTFCFRLMDLESRMYVGFGSSLRSEKEAYVKAMSMAKIINIDSIRLDRYYSVQKNVKFIEDEFGKEVQIYLIPKKNATLKGPWKWKDMLDNLVTDPKSYLHEYYRRNQSESAFSEDKRRFGWVIPQRREDRVETHNICTSLWHNMLWMGNE